jgi:hypothetical protein
MPVLNTEKLDVQVKVERPAAGEYGDYYSRYLVLVPDGDIFELLTKQIDTIRDTLGNLPAEKADYRFGPNEWTVKEVMGHINDTERVFAYRALRISRNDATPLPGFDQDQFVKESNYSERELSDLIAEFEFIRRANVLVFKNLSAETYLRCGTASNNPFSVRALLYVMVGHVNHHLGSYETDYGIPRK